MTELETIAALREELRIAKVHRDDTLAEVDRLRALTTALKARATDAERHVAVLQHELARRA